MESGIAWSAFIVDLLNFLSTSEAANSAEVIGAMAGCIAILIAKFGTIIGVRQIRSAHTAQREVLARQIYYDYLKLCVAEPIFASGQWKNCKDIPEAIAFEKYEWFVTVMLTACESILLHVAQDDEWIKAIKCQLEYHKDYIRSEDFREKLAPTYSTKLRNLL